MNRLALNLGIAVILATAGVAFASPKADAWFETIRELYELHDSDLHPVLLTELEQFEAAHPQDARIPGCWYYRGNVLAEKKEHRALAAWLKILVLAPDFEQAAAARDGVLRVATEKGRYEETAASFRKALDRLPVSGGPADRHFHYIELVRSILHKGLYEPMIDACYEFCARYPDDRRSDRVLVWQSDTFAAAGDEDAAAAVLRKAARMYPESELRPDMMFRRGVLLADDLKEPARAIEVFGELHEAFPDRPAGARALAERGRVKADERDYEGAAADLRAFADRYPDDDRTPEVLLELADLTYGKLKAWKRTDAVYEDIITRYPGDERALAALEKSAKLNRHKLKDLHRAAAQYARAGELFPAAEDSPDLVLDAAKIAKDKLKDLDLAITYWEQVQATWPDSEPAREAAREIEKAREKLAENK